jgi:glycosyl hydrolase family 16
VSSNLAGCATFMRLAAVAASTVLTILPTACTLGGRLEPEELITAEEHSPFVPAGYGLIWNDEFWELRMDPLGTGAGRWTDHIVGSGERSFASNGDDAWHGWDGDRGPDGKSPRPLHEAAGGSIVNVADGAMHLWGRTLPSSMQRYFGGKPFAAALVTTETSFGFRYGYLEVKARIALSQGHHFALWLLPRPWDWRQEVDIVELRGSEPGAFHAAAHHWDATDRRIGGSSHVYRPLAGPDQWHVFSLLWTADDLVWTVDGEEVHRSPNFIHAPMFFLASFEIDSRFSGPVTAATKWPAHAEIDYVRVYQPRRRAVVAAARGAFSTRSTAGRRRPVRYRARRSSTSSAGRPSTRSPSTI